MFYFVSLCLSEILRRKITISLLLYFFLVIRLILYCYINGSKVRMSEVAVGAFRSWTSSVGKAWCEDGKNKAWNGNGRKCKQVSKRSANNQFVNLEQQHQYFSSSINPCYEGRLNNRRDIALPIRMNKNMQWEYDYKEWKEFVAKLSV